MAVVVSCPGCGRHVGILNKTSQILGSYTCENGKNSCKAYFFNWLDYVTRRTLISEIKKKKKKDKDDRKS